MAKYAYSQAFPSGTISGAFDAEIDRQAQSGRVAHVFLDAVKSAYAVEVPASKAKFLAFRAEHVKFASMAKEEQNKLDTKPALWVPGHLKRGQLFSCLDAIAAGLTNCERMADSADWPALFAPAPKVKASASASVAAPALPASSATFPALGAAPKSAPAESKPAIDPAFGAHAMSMTDMVEALVPMLKAGLVPESMWLQLVQAHNAGKIKAIVKKPATAEAPSTVDAPAEQLALDEAPF